MQLEQQPCSCGHTSKSPGDHWLKSNARDLLPVATMAKRKASEIDSPFARLDAFARGEIWGLACAGWSVSDICATVVKKDGTSPSWHSVNDVYQRNLRRHLEMSFLNKETLEVIARCPF